MIPFPMYLRIKKKYCISYYGIINEFIWQLLYLTQSIKSEFPELELYISCKDEIIDDLKIMNANVIPRSEIEKYHFMHEYKINYNNEIHPILKIIEESSIPTQNLKRLAEKPQNKKCVIVTKAIAPFRSLNEEQIKLATQKARNEGFEVSINAPINDIAWVMGCESESLYKAGILGSKVTLIPTNDTKVFKRFFPNEEIFKI